MRPREFEELARARMGDHFGVSLKKRRLPGVPKEFDLVSTDGQTVGDAKYFTLVRGRDLPPAKFSVIAEHVWLLERTGARTQFLVFSNDERVPAMWLKTYGTLLGSVKFFFLSNDGQLKELTARGAER